MIVFICHRRCLIYNLNLRNPVELLARKGQLIYCYRYAASITL
jgi:hypothetical protein